MYVEGPSCAAPHPPFPCSVKGPCAAQQGDRGHNQRHFLRLRRSAGATGEAGLPGLRPHAAAAHSSCRHVQNADLLVLEFTFNEAADQPYTSPSRRGFEQLLRKLLRLRNSPAVLLLHHYAWYFAFGDGVPAGLFYRQAEEQLGTLAQVAGQPWRGRVCMAAAACGGGQLPAYKRGGGQPLDAADALPTCTAVPPLSLRSTTTFLAPRCATPSTPACGPRRSRSRCASAAAAVQQGRPACGPLVRGLSPGPGPCASSPPLADRCRACALRGVWTRGRSRSGPPPSRAASSTSITTTSTPRVGGLIWQGVGKGPSCARRP